MSKISACWRASSGRPSNIIARIGYAAWDWVREILYLWEERMRGRRELGELSDRALQDLAWKQTDVVGEIKKPFWRA